MPGVERIEYNEEGQEVKIIGEWTEKLEKKRKYQKEWARKNWRRLKSRRKNK